MFLVTRASMIFMCAGLYSNLAHRFSLIILMRCLSSHAYILFSHTLVDGLPLLFGISVVWNEQIIDIAKVSKILDR
jgi:hypothetical protein